MSKRVDPSIFKLPVEKIRAGYYSDAYFNHTKALMEDRRTNVLMQVFQKNHAVLGGVDEAIAVLKQCSGLFVTGTHTDNREAGSWYPGWDFLDVRALHDGDEISPHEPVLTIEGEYKYFAHLETVYLGTLARRTLIATNVRKVLDVANGKPIMYFPARHDHWVVQTGDGYAAWQAGAEGVSTDAQANWWGGKGIGTVPHALIAAYGGSTVDAAKAFADKYAGDMRVTVLVDFENDSVKTALEVADALGDKLWGVRLDTSDTMVDRSLWENMGQFKPTGVNKELVYRVRHALDDHDHNDVKIIVSGGFDAEKIASFEESGVPVDGYGVGASLIRGSNNFTADVVRVNGEPCAKAGRRELSSARLEEVE